MSLILSCCCFCFFSHLSSVTVSLSWWKVWHSDKASLTRDCDVQVWAFVPLRQRQLGEMPLNLGACEPPAEWITLVSDQHKQTRPSVITRTQSDLFCAQRALEKSFLWQSQGNILTPEAKRMGFRKPAGARAGVVSTDNRTRDQETHSAVFAAGVPES